MARIDRAAKAVARALAVLGLGALLCFAVMTMADGLLRFFFASPIDAVRDVGGLVAAFAVACCIPVAIVERSNITIRFVSGVIGPRAGRMADVAAAILVEIILLLMTWQFVLFAAQAQATGQRDVDAAHSDARRCGRRSRRFSGSARCCRSLSVSGLVRGGYRDDASGSRPVSGGGRNFATGNDRRAGHCCAVRV